MHFSLHRPTKHKEYRLPKTTIENKRWHFTNWIDYTEIQYEKQIKCIVIEIEFDAMVFSILFFGIGKKRSAIHERTQKKKCQKKTHSIFLSWKIVCVLSKKPNQTIQLYACTVHERLVLFYGCICAPMYRCRWTLTRKGYFKRRKEVEEKKKKPHVDVTAAILLKTRNAQRKWGTWRILPCHVKRAANNRWSSNIHENRNSFCCVR